VSGKTTRMRTDAEIKALLERVSRPLPLDEMRDRGMLAPDRHFLLKRIAGCDADKVKDVWRRAFLELLRNWQRLGIPLSQETLDQTASELERLWWPPDPKAEKCRRRQAKAKELRAELWLLEAIYRREDFKRPRSMAKEDVARNYGHASGEALRKALQANRVNRRPRHKPRG